MRALLIAALFVMCAAATSEAAVALVSGQIAYDDTQPFITDGTGVATLPTNCTTGNSLLIAIGTLLDRTITSVVDNGGNTYSTDAGLTITGGGTAAEVWIYWAPCTTAANEVTVTLAAPVTDQGIVLIAEFSGLDNADLLEDTVEVVDTASPYNSGDVTTTIADSLLFGNIISDSAADFTNEAGWTDARDWAGGLVGYKILSASGNDNWDPTSAASENAGLVLGAFNGSSGAAPSAAYKCLTLGVC